MTTYNKYIVEYRDKYGEQDHYVDKFVSDWSLEHNLTIIARELHANNREFVSIKVTD